MDAAERIGVPEDVREIVLPLGATIHMDGTCLAAVLKIAVLFALFGRPFSGVETLAGVVGVALLCGVVMSGIPGGGFFGRDADCDAVWIWAGSVAGDCHARDAGGPAGDDD